MAMPVKALWVAATPNVSIHMIRNGLRTSRKHMEGGREGGRERSTEAGRRGGNSQKDGREAAPAPSAASAAPVTDTRREGERLETQQPDRTACCGVRRRRPVTPKRHGQFRLSK